MIKAHRGEEVCSVYDTVQVMYGLRNKLVKPLRFQFFLNEE